LPRFPSLLCAPQNLQPGEKTRELYEGARNKPLCQALIKKHLLRFLAAKRVQFFAYKGKVKSRRIVEALDIQLAAFELACKLKGSFAPVRTESHSRAITTIILDVPRPPRPGPNGEMPPTTIEVQPSSNGHKPQKPE